MISEWRKLTFSEDELAHAISAYLRVARGIGADDRLGDIAIKDRDNVTLMVTVFSGTGGRDFELKPEAIAALMVAHCIRAKTPLPKRATKSIALDGDRVSLVLAL